MIYSDEELKRWWQGLSNSAKKELFETIFENARSTSFKSLVLEWWRAWDTGQELPPRTLGHIRKWAR